MLEHRIHKHGSIVARPVSRSGVSDNSASKTTAWPPADDPATALGANSRLPSRQAVPVHRTSTGAHSAKSLSSSSTATATAGVAVPVAKSVSTVATGDK